MFVIEKNNTHLMCRWISPAFPTLVLNRPRCQDTWTNNLDVKVVAARLVTLGALISRGPRLSLSTSQDGSLLELSAKPWKTLHRYELRVRRCRLHYATAEVVAGIIRLHVQIDELTR